VSTQAGRGAYALLTDGTTIEIRAARPEDFAAVRKMHATMSPDNLYLRFFSMSPAAAEQEARRICREPGPDHAALLAVLDGEVVGCGAWELASDGSGPAEVAMTVADDMHNRGIGTLLLEHLVSLARGRGIGTFAAETLTENTLMLQVFANAGLRAHRTLEDGVYDLRFPLPAGEGDTGLDAYRDAVAERERSADVASLRHVLAPASVAVIGAGRRPGSVGRAILRNIVTGGFPGPVYAVNPGASELDGVPCVPSPAELPGQVDLAVVAVPAPAVPAVAGDCGRRGVRALAVTTSGLDRPARGELLGICRRHGMRLVGPASFGVANTAISLDATFAARHPSPGLAGLALESTGGTGFVLLEHLSRLGVGISTLVSLGDKDDVAGTDMLLWWESDPATKLAVLYLESFGNPRKFARTARRVSCAMPVLTVLTDTVLADETPFQEALFEQAGIIATRGFGELIETTALLATQPVPAGRTVAIVSNVRSAAQLAASAGAAAGLRVRHLVETTTPVSADAFRQRMEQLAADDEVHAVVAIVLPTGATGDLEAAILQASTGKPLAAVVLTQPESVRLIDNRIPAYGSPEAAVRALARAAGYGAWRAAPRGTVPDLPDVRTADARALILDCAAGWLGPAQAAELLRCYGIPLADPASPGAKVRVRVAGDRVFGPLVRLEAGDSYRTARFTPLTDVDAAYLTRERPDLDLAGLLLRVSRLADDLPEVTELELDLGGAAVISARVKVEPYQPQDPYLRRLR
jgi:acyl-CoA synthetase (NDP forming)/GNAT superfamily N-acetyltransferase